MYTQSILEKYAKLVAKIGVNVQQGQPVILRTSPEALPLAREVVKACYEAGASYVRVDINDGVISKYGITYQSEEQLADIPDWFIERDKYFQDRHVCFVSIASPDPKAMIGIDPKKMRISQIAYRKKAGEEVASYAMLNKGQWCIVAYPNVEWAKQVFPEDKEKVAVKKLGNAILKCMRISAKNDPEKAWKRHNREIKKHCAKLNELQLKELHYKNSKGTDFTVQLPHGHIWEGGCEKTSTKEKIVFNPNMPTEEAFTLPHREGADGIVYASKPLVFAGNIIDEFWIKFKGGKVIDYGAKKGKEFLKAIIEADENSCRLGEVALVPYDSPISQSGILFYNTLFDENASCHLALGAAYETCLKGSAKMSKEELIKAGVNSSVMHVDFMIGTKDLEIIGTTEEGKKVQIFKDGNFAF